MSISRLRAPCVLAAVLLGNLVPAQIWQQNVASGIPGTGPTARFVALTGIGIPPAVVRFEEATGNLHAFSTSWTLLPLTPSPSFPRTLSAMAGAEANCVLFGGIDPTGIVGDTWALVIGTGWVQVSLGGGPGEPSPRFGHAMTATPGSAWPATPGTVFLQGGFNGTFLNDFWQFRFGTWSPVFTLGAPPPGRMRHVLCRGPSNTLVLFGGDNGATGTALLDDTWVFSFFTLTWTPMATGAALRPSPRQDAGAVFDTVRATLVLFGGTTAAGTASDTWEWNGFDWRLVGAAGSPPGIGPGLFMDPFTPGKLVATSLDPALVPQMHVFAPSPAGFTTFPDLWSCSATGTQSLWLSAPRAALPIIGQTFNMEVTGVSPAGVLIGAFEFPGSHTPIPLGCNCDQFLTGGAGTATVFIPNVGSTSPFPLPIANNQALFNQTIDIQVFLLDNTACPVKTTPLGIATLGN